MYLVLRLILFCVIISIPISGTAQVNLVPNPSFENYTACPTTSGQLSNSTSWFIPDNHYGSPDYFNACTANGLISVPSNNWGSQNPASGNGYAGFSSAYFGIPNFREYLEVKLNASLVAGDLYLIKYKYSLADNSRKYTNGLGIYLSQEIVSGNFDNKTINVVPQIQTDTLITNNATWKEDAHYYTATGGERYLTMGNFFTDATTQTAFADTTNFNGIYIYIDDVAVIPQCVQPELGNDFIWCGTSHTLDAGFVSNASYQWQDSSTASTYTVVSPGTYWVQITVNNCTRSDTIHITDRQKIQLDTTLCEGQTIEVDATSIGAINYEWQDGSSYPVYTITNQGIYFVKIQSEKCIFSDTIMAKYILLPKANLSNDKELCIGESIELNAYNSFYEKYLWIDNSTDSVFIVKRPGTYWVTLYSQSCQYTDTVHIYKSQGCEVSVEMPNVFTPNSDNTNEQFAPYNLRGIVHGRLSIYNRWGQKVFETTDLTGGWNGKIKEEQGAEGIYFWYLSCTSIYDKEIEINGTMTLLR